jgi:hypothetical protein
MKPATPEEAKEYQKTRAEQNEKSIAQMPKGSPEQFMAQCERLKKQGSQPLA